MTLQICPRRYSQLEITSLGFGFRKQALAGQTQAVGLCQSKRMSIFFADNNRRIPAIFLHRQLKLQFGGEVLQVTALRVGVAAW